MSRELTLRERPPDIDEEHQGKRGNLVASRVNSSHVIAPKAAHAPRRKSRGPARAVPELKSAGSWWFKTADTISRKPEDQAFVVSLLKDAHNFIEQRQEDITEELMEWRNAQVAGWEQVLAEMGEKTNRNAEPNDAVAARNGGSPSEPSGSSPLQDLMSHVFF
jgi:hypothetical protein